MKYNDKTGCGLRTMCLLWVYFFGSMIGSPSLFGYYQEPTENAGEAKEASPLVDEQTNLAKQFGDLESLLLKLSEIEADSNPIRASILQRASKLGKESSLQSRLKEAAKALESKQFSRAIEEQEATKASLEQLLTLLLSEDRDDRVREEKKKIEEMIKEIQRLNRLQKSLRQRTESTDSPQELSEDQQGLEQKAGELAEDLNPDQDNNAKNIDQKSPTSPPSETDNNQSENKNGESEKGENSESEMMPEDGKPKEDKPEESKSEESKPQESNEPNESKVGEKNEGQPKSDQNQEVKPQSADSPSNDSQPNNSKPSDSKPSDALQKGKEESQPSPDSPPSDSAKPQDPSGSKSESGESQQPQEAQQPPQPQTPQQRVEQAQRKMNEAKKKLENAEKEQAVEAQKQAEEELRQAVDELEQILRQLREEEVERTLVQLETRFRRMLEMQLEVNEETTKLDRIASDQRERAWEQRVVNLSQAERKIIGEAERALLLLREEGTSLAFPEAGEQIVADMQTVAGRLEGSDVGGLTQTIEAEIVTGLEEILEALTAAQRELEKKKNDNEKPPPPQPGEPQQQPLVDKLAELRLIRTMQMRINSRTNKLADLMGTKDDAIGLSEQGEMRQQIRDLGGRQQRLQQITRDIVVGKGQ